MTALALVTAFALSGPAFGPGYAIPRRYTCDGANRPPPLRWTASPPGTFCSAWAPTGPVNA